MAAHDPATAQQAPGSTTDGLSRLPLLRNVSVGLKIALVGAAGLLTATSVGGLGWRSLGGAHDDLTTTIRDAAQPTIDLGAVRESYARVRSRLAQATAYDNQKDISTALSAMDSSMTAVTDGIDRLERTPLTPTQRLALTRALRPSVLAAFDVIRARLVPLAAHPMTPAQRREFTRLFTTDLRRQIDTGQKALDLITDLAQRRLDAAVVANGAAHDRAVASLIGVTQELSSTSAQITESAVASSEQSSTVAAAAEQVSRNVETVSAATEQMSASISEIAGTSTEAARIAGAAVTEAGNANQTVDQLDRSSIEVGNVVKLITSIAEQTAAVHAIERISQIIEQVNAFQLTIASAVEEQATTTTDMSRSLGEAATGSAAIAGGPDTVTTAARSASAGSVATHEAAEDLSHLAQELTGLVTRFRT